MGVWVKYNVVVMIRIIVNFPDMRFISRIHHFTIGHTPELPFDTLSVSNLITPFTFNNCWPLHVPHMCLNFVCEVVLTFLGATHKLIGRIDDIHYTVVT